MKLLSKFIRIILLATICLSSLAMADTKYPALRDRVDPELQKAFDKALTDYFGAENSGNWPKPKKWGLP